MIKAALYPEPLGTSYCMALMSLLIPSSKSAEDLDTHFTEKKAEVREVKMLAKISWVAGGAFFLTHESRVYKT